MIADSLWRRRFQADPGIVGRKIGLDAKPFLVIGVLQQRGDVLRMVLQQGMTPVCAGAVAALGIGQYVASLLFQVSPRGFRGGLFDSGATRVNPIDALRFD
jgi:hypothetical protein